MSSLEGYAVDLTRVRPAAKPPSGGFWEDFGAGVVPGFAALRSGPDLPGTQTRYEAAVYGEMIAAANRAGVAAPARNVEFLGAPLFTMPGSLRNPAFAAEGRFSRKDRDDQLVREAYARARAADPSLPDLTSPGAVQAEVQRRRQADFAAAQAEIPNSVGGIAGSFIGGMGASFTDPVTLLTLGLGAGAIRATTTARTIAMRAGAEAGVQGAIAGVLVPAIMADAEANEFDYDLGDAALDVALSATLGAGFGALSGAVDAPVVRRAAEAASDATVVGTRAALARLRGIEEQRALTPEEADALTVLEVEAEIAEASPYVPTPEGQAAHVASLEEATAALIEDRPSGLPEAPVVPVAPAVVEQVTAGFDPVPHVKPMLEHVQAGKSINLSALGKAMGLSEMEAQRVLAMVASNPRNGLRMNGKTGAISRVPQRRGPVDVITFLADRGGLRDGMGHDLKNTGAIGSSWVPGAGPLVRRNGGLTLDEAGELLWEAGYIGNRQDGNALTSRPTEAEVLDFIDNAARRRSEKRPVYLQEEQADADLVRANRLDDDEFQTRAAFMREEWAAEGFEAPTDDEIRFLLQLEQELGRPPDIEEYVLSQAWIDLQVAQGKRPKPMDDDWDVPFDELKGENYGDATGPAERAAAAAEYPDAPGRPEAGAGAAAAPDAEPGTIADAGGAADAGDGAGSADAGAGGPASDGPGDAVAGGGRSDAVAGNPLDLGEQVDPAIAARQRQQAQLGANSPLRPGDRAEQADVDGLPMFDAERSPDMFGSPAADAASGRAIAEFDDPMGAGATTQADLLIHDLRRDAEAGDASSIALDVDGDADLRAVLDGLDADEAALAALKGCL